MRGLVAVYLACTSLQRINGFSSLQRLTESISYAVSIVLLVRSPPPLLIEPITEKKFLHGMIPPSKFVDFVVAIMSTMDTRRVDSFLLTISLRKLQLD
jgi:hypothetical protein